ncbi:hypothetical protein [uncultured Kordia sp.]|uniref:hypothetical protein n=1 Tax=uncultured Kordia sp. TaxID=507699 RepID=UPI0026270FB5|nr:hypothetical protein [uncultured Kordia sp.]
MKKKNLKSLKLNKRSISNFNDVKGSSNQTGLSPCEFTPTYYCDYMTNPDGMCLPVRL